MRRCTRRCLIVPRRGSERAREPRTAADRRAGTGGRALARRRGPGTACRRHDAAPRAARRPGDTGDAAAGPTGRGRGRCRAAGPGRCPAGRTTRDAVRAVRHVSVRRAARDDDPRSHNRLPVLRTARGEGGAAAGGRGTRADCPWTRRERAGIRAGAGAGSDRDGAVHLQSPGTGGVRGHRSVARAREDAGLPAAPGGGAGLRRCGRPGDCDRRRAGAGRGGASRG